MNRYPQLPAHLRQQLAHIDPSTVYTVRYYPCSIYTTTGQLIRCAYLVEETGYFRQWGIWPEDDPGKRSIQLHEVSSIAKSPDRLPVRYTDELYDAGESGMGYLAFKILFKNGVTQFYITGGARDFVIYPTGLNGDDICEVLPHIRPDAAFLQPPTYYWCLYSEPGDIA